MGLAEKYSMDGQEPRLPPIAIIGMSCRLPGNVSTVEDFWQMMSRAQCGWSEIPGERFNTEAYHHPNPAKKGCFNAKGGYFLSQDPALFDAPFFNLTRPEAEAMDPQQRLLLESTYEALENAGIPKESLIGRKVGVFVGGAASDYGLGTLRDLDNTPMFDATGNHQSILAGRISHFFDLRGPSVSVDTACSSSLHALHQAVQSIRNGESEQAIVASCHLNLQPGNWVSMSLSRLFSDEGRTYSFDSRAKSGFARGEGAGCLILKPLEQAIQDNDSVRSVIVNTGTNQDGRTIGLTSPNREAQEQLMCEVYTRAGIDPEDAGFVEAHGTGTKVGDPIEATAIYNVFGKGRTPKQPLYLGSVKSNIGHLESASGIISVIKSSLMLEKGFILPNINFETPNEQIPMAKWNIKVPTSQRPWPMKKKYISCNNFGFGGSNAHCVLARPTRLLVKPQSVEAADDAAQRQRLFVVSANDEAAATKSMNQLIIFIEQHPEVYQQRLICDVAYTLGQRRSHLPWRIGVVASSLGDLAKSLSAGDVKPSRASVPPSVAFVYTGQGAQWHAMGRELNKSHPVFANVLQAADACLRELGADFSLVNELDKAKDASRVSQVHISQPACTAVQLALTALLRSWGIRPVSVTGHSSGEIAAAYAAGALSLETAMAVAYFRGQAVLRLREKHADLRGAMLAVGTGADEIAPTVKLLQTGTAVVACENSPRSVTVSGDESAVEELAAQAERMRLFHRKLRVDVAYHSPHMKLVAGQYRDFIQDARSVAGEGVRFFSSLHGREVRDVTTLNASYWVDNLVCPVRFSTALRELCSAAEAPDVIVEVGPHAALEGPIKQTLQAMSDLPSPPRYLPTLVRDKDATTTMLNLAASLYTAGQPLEFAAINGEDTQPTRPSLVTDMAPYPWSRQRYWSESRLSRQHRLKPFPRHDLLGTLTDSSNHDICPTWRNVLRLDDVPWLSDHQMMGLTTFPLAGYVSMAVEAATQRATLRGLTLAAAKQRFVLREVQAIRPLLLCDGGEYELVTSVAAYAEGTRSYSDKWDEFRICSWEEGKGWTEHCRGLIGVRGGEGNGRGVGAASASRASRKFCHAGELCGDGIAPDLFYQELEQKGAIYGPAFRGLRDIRRGADRAVGVVDVADTTSTMPLAHQSPYLVHPTLLDQVIQLSLPLLGAGRGGMKTLYMPSAIRELHIGTGVPRQVGQSLRVAGGGPVAALDRPRPTDFTLHAFPSPDGEAALSIVGLRMNPVRNEAASNDAPRELCFRLDWEPAPEKTSAEDERTEVIGSDLNPILLPAISIITDRPAVDDLVRALSSALLTRTGQRPSFVALSSLGEMKDNAYVVLSELDRPLLPDLTPEALSSVQTLLLRSAGTLWVTSGAYKSCTNPTANMVSGLLRTVRSETAAKAATLDLDPDSTLSDTSRAELILQVLERVFRPGDGNDDVTTDMEYAEQAGSLVVPRIVTDDAVNEHIHRELYPSGPRLQPLDARAPRLLQLDIGTVGALDTLYFDDAPNDRPLGEHEIEIRVAATGMNFKDVVIAMGQLPHPGYLGVECAGVVSRVGKAVSHLAYGDRVCAMTEGAYSTFARCAATSAVRIPDDMAFEDAASIPVVYGTAYYGLVELARLTAGERVLIHAAAGGVGQAAIQLAKMVGAEIFATVGSPEKKALIMERYGVPENRIFSSRETSFGPAIREGTRGVGVDVVFNSLAGEFLRETWECIAPFGRFIEIGKRDITSNTRLEMARFDCNVTFSSVDLTLVAAQRPATMARTLSAVMALVAARVLRPIQPITVVGLGEVEKAFRLLQSGKTMGKLVVVPKPGEKLRATDPKPDAALFHADITYIIVGGTGGLGRSIARWMVAQGARNLVLASRSGGADGAVADLVNDLQQTAKANITVKACDVADARSVENLMAECREQLPPIRGCVHAAMVLRDVLFEKMTHPDYSEVIRSKVLGAWNIHTALASAPLDFFIVLSSVAGIVGNRGQAAYAAANTFLDALARHRRRLGLPGTSLALTAVQDVGYLAEEGAARQAVVAQNLGGSFLREAEVLALLKAAVQGRLDIGGGHCLTGLGLAAGNEVPYFATDAKFRRLRDAVMASVDASEPGGSPSLSIENALARASSSKEAVGVIVTGLAAKLATILMIPPESIDPSRPVTAYGLDSLNVIEWRNWITKTLKVNFQVLELLAAGSLTNLAASIWKKKAAV
ncbi:polyketide synthase [Parathielavia appendiculata]|uniref:Polyketide synthase n=1 Tax=Parathielavia appendiculata TaxID=2587402 RepID=A0AAN6TW79_9PEZI|nr:polyketide synthase [Parathielavia appendiculata]